MWKWRGFINGFFYYNLIKNRIEKDNLGEIFSGWEKKKKKLVILKLKRLLKRF